MAYKGTVAPRALQDLQQIGDTIARDDPQAAADDFARPTAAYRSLSAFPERVLTWGDLLPGFRAMPFGNRLIFYKIVADEVRVLRVLHGARDIPGAFDDDRIQGGHSIRTRRPAIMKAFGG